MTTFIAGQILTAALMNSIRTPAEWTPWNVVFTANFTKGNAVDTSGYWRSGRLIFARLDLVLGTTSAVGTLPVFTLPVPAAVGYGGGQVATFRDVSASADYDGFIRLAGTASGYIEAKNAAGANDGRTGIGAAVPFTWAPGDIIDGYLGYEAAS